MIWEDHSLLLVSLLETPSVTCWKDQIVFHAPLSCCRKYSSLFLEGKIQCCPLYCSLPPSVLYQRLGQIMVLKDHSLISLFVHFGEGIWVQNKSWNLDLAFWKQKLFRCESKIICFWNLATPCFFFEKEIIYSCVWQRGLLVKICHEMTFLFSKWRAREKARGFVWEKQLVSF